MKSTLEEFKDRENEFEEMIIKLQKKNEEIMMYKREIQDLNQEKKDLLEREMD